MSSGSPEEKRRRAQLYFEKGEQRRVEVEQALGEHRAKIDAVAAKTIRLRALRLAKEAADMQAVNVKAQRTIRKSAISMDAQDCVIPKRPRRKKLAVEI